VSLLFYVLVTWPYITIKHQISILVELRVYCFWPIYHWRQCRETFANWQHEVLEKLIIGEHLSNVLPFMIYEGSWSSQQDSTAGSYPKPLNLMNSLHTLHPVFFSFCFNIILSFTPKYFCRFSKPNYICIYDNSYAYYTPCQFYPPRFYDFNNVCWREEATELQINAILLILHSLLRPVIFLNVLITVLTCAFTLNARHRISHPYKAATILQHILIFMFLDRRHGAGCVLITLSTRIQEVFGLNLGRNIG
jgi:hypothetical protein